MCEIDSDRLRKDFDIYSRIGRTENNGLNRLTLSQSDKAIRDRFVHDLEKLDIDIEIDAVGNIFGTWNGQSDEAPVLIGSHLDSQPAGGRYDGQLGVLIALETIRTFEGNGIEIGRPIEIVNWTNEEGVRFQPSLMGSKTFSGELSQETAHTITDTDGITVENALGEIGYLGNIPCKPRSIHSYVELHIEQNSELERNEKTIGVVEGTFGKVWAEVSLIGVADHAGSTPLHLRKDSLHAAIDTMRELYTLPQRMSQEAVITMNNVETAPPSINTIPSESSFTIDYRWFDGYASDDVVDEISNEVKTAAERHGLDFDLEILQIREPDWFSPAIRRAIIDSAESLDIPYQSIVSGAGHDAKSINRITDSGMIFIPSVGGISHAENEFTEWDDVVAGANVFVNTVRTISAPG